MITTSEVHHSRLVNRSPIFYGWVVWAVATVGLIATSPGQSFTVAYFFDSFIADFGLNRTEVSSLYALGTFIGALSLTWLGRKIDRHGNRIIGVAISGLFALALMAFSLVSGPLTLLFGFIAIRGLGQGSLSLVNTTVITQWFQHRRGRAMAFTLVVFALFQSAYVPGLQHLLETTDWRQVWIMLGIGVGVTILPLTWVLMRNRPEEFGLLPDGNARAAQEVGGAETIVDEENWTLREAMRTAIFWVFVTGRVLPPTWGTGLIIHQTSIFQGLGYDAAMAAQTYGTIALITAGASLASGVIIDRFNPGRVLALQLSMLITTMGVAMVMTEAWMLLVYALAFGLLMGNAGVFDGAVWANLFGRAHQGEIRGFVTTSMVAGSAAGPIIFALSYDNLGGYAPALWLGIALAAILAVLSFFVRKPR